MTQDKNRLRLSVTLKPDILELIEDRDWMGIREALSPWPPPEIADLLTDLDKKSRVLRGGMDVAVVVSMTMVLVVIVGSLIGLSMPFLLSKLKLDPATASAPLITSIADISGVMIYFSLAAWYLGVG